MARNSGQTAGFSQRGQLPTTDSVDTAAANLRCAAALIAALVEGGLRHAVISSGSRCTPLVIAAGEQPGLTIWTNPDERSAAFFALGVAKALRQPAALICTSGTAAANYFPAVIEARMSGTPLIVITADRPPHLRDTGAPQTIDQRDLYGCYPVHFKDLPLPHLDAYNVHHWSAAADHALEAARSSMGPVHLNAPFCEPLLPRPDDAATCMNAFGPPAREPRQRTLSDGENDTDGAAIGAVAELLAASCRPVIVCGPQDQGFDLVPLIAQLAQSIGAPVLGDIASQVRQWPRAVCYYDLFLRDTHTAARLAPDFILRIGGLPVSKSLNEWIASTPATVKIGLAAGRVADPHGCLTHVVQAAPQVVLASLLDRISRQPDNTASYADLWRKVDSAASLSIMGSQTSRRDVLESQILVDVCEHIGRDMNLFLSNSMPIRWADMYVRARDGFPRVLVNRGANGIDGIVSTAAGVSAATRQTTVCVLGDLTFLHDQNGLWRLTAEKLPLKLIVLNNGGGGVFHFLPVASHAAHFEPLVAMPHSTDLAHLAAAHGLAFHRVDSNREFKAAFCECLDRVGPEVIEVRTNRRKNAQFHREIIAHVSDFARLALESR